MYDIDNSNNSNNRIKFELRHQNVCLFRRRYTHLYCTTQVKVVNFLLLPETGMLKEEAVDVS